MCKSRYTQRHHAPVHSLHVVDVIELVVLVCLLDMQNNAKVSVVLSIQKKKKIVSTCPLAEHVSRHGCLLLGVTSGIDVHCSRLRVAA